MSTDSKRSSSHYFAVIYPCPSCGEKAGVSFDRTLCACGMMHHYCSACGVQADDCWDGAEASPTPERTEVERLRLALTRAMDRGTELEEALQFFFSRSFGVSSEGMFREALGIPQRWHESYPRDRHDSAGVEETYDLAPDWLKKRMLPRLTWYREIARLGWPDTPPPRESAVPSLESSTE